MKTDDVYKLEAEQDVEALIKALREDGDFVVRMQAARALGEICDERAIEALFYALEDDAVGVQNKAGEALVKIGGPEVISGFIGMMSQTREGSSRKHAIANALKQITGEDFGTNYYRWSEWWGRQNH